MKKSSLSSYTTLTFKIFIIYSITKITIVSSEPETPTVKLVEAEHKGKEPGLTKDNTEKTLKSTYFEEDNLVTDENDTAEVKGAVKKTIKSIKIDLSPPITNLKKDVIIGVSEDTDEETTLEVAPDSKFSEDDNSDNIFQNIKSSKKESYKNPQKNKKAQAKKQWETEVDVNEEIEPDYIDQITQDSYENDEFEETESILPDLQLSNLKEEVIFDKPNTSNILYTLDTNKLKMLANSEIILYNKLRDYFAKLQRKNKSKVNSASIQRYLEDFESSSKMPKSQFSINTREEKARLIVKNPILMFRLINRLALTYKQMKEDLLKDNARILYKLERFEIQVKSLPDEEDLTDALHGLIRIQEVYDFNVKRFAAGKIGPFKTNATLRAIDCYNIGKFALENGALAIAIQWLKESLRLTTNTKDHGQVTQEEITKLIKSAIIYHNQEWEEHEMGPPQFSTHLFANKISDDFKTGVKMSKIIRKEVAGLRDKSSADMEYRDLCVGKNFQTNLEKSKLNCWLETEKHPYWKINPLKIEQLNLDPELIQIHDFIGNNKITQIKKASAPLLNRSSVFNPVDKPNMKSFNPRSSLTGWIDNNLPENSFLLPLYKQIQFATGLNLIERNSSEQLQVVDYSALGSHYNIHRDALTDNQVEGKYGGNRIVTFMMYLNDVQMGGSTAFPIMGTSTKPKKGSALMWYNLYKNGSVDLRTMHAGCPTVLGRKQIANKWILSDENMFNRKCALNQME